MTRLRSAVPGDAAAIAEIWNLEIREGVSTFNSQKKCVHDVLEMIEQRGAAFVIAEEAQAIVGFATYGQFRGGIGYAHSREHSIYLTQAARGRGIGRGLMQRLEQQARSADIHCLIAGIGGENTDAISFHLSLGFKQVGRLPEVGHKFGRWMDLVLMQKIL